VIAWAKRVVFGVKKEKRKETQILSMPYPIRARQEKRQAKGFPANDLIRH